MKRSDLVSFIKESIFEFLEEGTIITDKSGKQTYVSNNLTSSDISGDSDIKSAVDTSGKKLKETNSKLNIINKELKSLYKQKENLNDKINSLEQSKKSL